MKLVMYHSKKKRKKKKLDVHYLAHLGTEDLGSEGRRFL